MAKKKKETKKNIIPLRMSDDLYSKVCKSAEERQQSLSDWIRQTIINRLIDEERCENKR